MYQLKEEAPQRPPPQVYGNSVACVLLPLTVLPCASDDLGDLQRLEGLFQHHSFNGDRKSMSKCVAPGR